MPQLLASSLLILLFANVPLAMAQATDPKQGNAGTRIKAAAGWPEEPDQRKEPRGSCEAQELPEPSLTEPFAIGEALYDPARVGVAVVSLLELMGVGIDRLDGTPLRPGGRRGGAPFRFNEREVRLLIEMERADAAATAKKSRPPFSFRDLHRAVAPLLPEFPIERLAGAYSEAYQANPDALVPQVLMGQPIEPNTRLMRTQIWLLLVGGFVPPGTQNPAPA